MNEPFVPRAHRPLAALVCGLALLTGCASGDRLVTDVTGTVTVDGVPVEAGQILFRRTDGEQKGYEGTITNGAYRLQCEPGPVRVEITAFRVVPGKFTTVNGPKEPVREMYIPEKYNAKTTLQHTLTGSSSVLPFELSSK